MASSKVRADCIRKLEKDGRLTAQALLEAARSKKHPMHSDFLWDDEAAGEEYRLSQARTYISAVRIVITTSKKKLSSVNYVRDPGAAPGPGYVSMTRLRTEQETAEEVLMSEIARLQSIFERTREIAVVLGLEAEHRAAIDAVLVLSSRMRRGPPSTGLDNGDRVHV